MKGRFSRQNIQRMIFAAKPLPMQRKCFQTSNLNGEICILFIKKDDEFSTGLLKM
jgi:hypothetical protein